MDVIKTFFVLLKDLICFVVDILVVFLDYKLICIRFLNFMVVLIFKYLCLYLRNIYVNDNVKFIG